MAKKQGKKLCPVCDLEFTISTAMNEDKYCSLACENGTPAVIKKQKYVKKY